MDKENNLKGCGELLFAHPEEPKLKCYCGDSCGYLCDDCKKKETLSEKIVFNPEGINWISEKNVKEKIQHAERRLKEDVKKGKFTTFSEFIDGINKIFKEEFGEKLR